MHATTTTVDHLRHVLWHHSSVAILCHLWPTRELCTRLEWHCRIVHPLALWWSSMSGLTIHWIRLIGDVLDPDLLHWILLHYVIHWSTWLVGVHHGVVLHVEHWLSGHSLLGGLGTGGVVRHSRLARLMMKLLSSTWHATSLVLL